MPVQPRSRTCVRSLMTEIQSAIPANVDRILLHKRPHEGWVCAAQDIGTIIKVGCLANLYFLHVM